MASGARAPGSGFPTSNVLGRLADSRAAAQSALVKSPPKASPPKKSARTDSDVMCADHGFPAVPALPGAAVPLGTPAPPSPAPASGGGSGGAPPGAFSSAAPPGAPSADFAP
eukprot:3275211-Pyramimonas_sp.AAC.1